MNISEILTNIDIGIQTLIREEFEILQRGLNELNLNGHLRGYLVPLFPGLNVDPEYNGDILKPNDRKALEIASNKMIEIGIEPNETGNYLLTPDIIIHRRNIYDDNLVVIEVKKDSNSQKKKDFDLLKLKHMTVDYLGNHYNYKLGLAIVLGTKHRAGLHEITYIQNGSITNRSDLTQW